MRLAYQTNTWGGVVGHPVGVTSIKDLYYLANGSTEDALRDIATAGYEGVELFDGNLMQYADSVADFTALLDNGGLSLVGVYSGANFIFADVLPEELWRIENAARVGSELGAEFLVVGGGAQRTTAATDADYDNLGAGLDAVVEIAERHGLAATYHPHLSTIVETPDQVDKILERTSIGLCPDTGHVIAGGGDPAQLISRHAARIPYVHLKDIDTETGSFVPLGQGALDVDGVMGALTAAGYDGWITVELDAWDDPLAGAAASHRRLEPHLAGASNVGQG
jgi:inosose dehydratase